MQHLETYWAILEKVKGSLLRLTKYDDEIYEHLKRDFPDFDPAATINESEMKSKSGKDRWRKFMMVYEKTINDYNFGTIMRTNPKFEHEEHTTIFSTIWSRKLLLVLPGLELTAISVSSSPHAVLRCRDREKQSWFE